MYATLSTLATMISHLGEKEPMPVVLFSKKKNEGGSWKKKSKMRQVGERKKKKKSNTLSLSDMRS